MTDETSLPHLDEDGEELIKALAIRYDPTKDNLIIDDSAFSKKLEAIKNKGEKVILQSGGEFGINIMLESRTQNIAELKKMAEECLIFLRDNIPIKHMLGVG